MLNQYISGILYVTGGITALAGLQYLFPVQMLRLLNKIAITDEAGLFFARHWALLAFVIGGLLIHAGAHAELRTPILLAATVEKLGLVLLVITGGSKPYAKGMRVAAGFDTACSILYLIYLIGN